MSDILKIISDVFKKLSDFSGAFLGVYTLKKGKFSSASTDDALQTTNAPMKV